MKSLIKDILREIWATKNRFLSIMAIIALGTGFFAGIKATCPNMVETAQAYYEGANLMDMQVKGTLGLTDDDVAAIQALSSVDGIRPGYSVYAFGISESDTNQKIIKVMSMDVEGYANDPNYISKPSLVEGRQIQAVNECLVDAGSISTQAYAIGDVITLSGDGETADAINLTSELNYRQFTVVGKVQTPEFISYERGQSIIGSGTVNSYMFISDEAFNYSGVYTDIYVTFAQTKSMSFDDPMYASFISSQRTKIEEIASARTVARYDEIIALANEELAKNQEELDKGMAEYRSSLASFNKQIADAEKKIKDGESQLAELKASLPDYQAQYDSGLAEYNSGRSQLADAENELADAKEQLATARDAYSQINSAISVLDDAIAMTETYIEIYGDVELSDEMKAAINAASGQLNSILADYSESLKELGITPPSFDTDISTSGDALNSMQSLRADLISSRSQMSGILSDAKGQVADAEDQIASAKKELASGKAQLDELKEFLDGAPELIKKSEAEIASGKKKLQSERRSGQALLAAGKAQLDEGQKQLDEARAQIGEIKMAEWLVFDRNDNPGYSGFIENTERIDQIAAVFPIFFILVAALVCLTTMTRMVEDQRTQIGTLKALGYSNLAVISKYLAYAISASLLGCVIGLAVGFAVLPTVIFNAYRNMYSLPDMVPTIRWDYAIICTVAAVICTGSAAFASCYRELGEKPALLMRTKAPKAGKRILLERIKFIWEKLNFMQKVTMRNMFRYKKRVLMTVFGIAGCTALLLTGFGLHNSICSIATRQYGEICTYDLQGYFSDGLLAEDKQNVIGNVRQISNVSEAMLADQQTVYAVSGDVSKECYLWIPGDETKINDYIALQERVTKKPLTLGTDGAIINEKLAKMLGVAVGESFTMSMSDEAEISVKVTGITENYALNYIYIAPSLYTSLTGNSVAYNMFVANVADEAAILDTSTAMMKDEAILTVANMRTAAAGAFEDVVSSLSYIVVVIIVAAGMLAFVVLYNLANINITERIREIATIKVLGFTESEVSGYISRENTLSTVLGIAAGLLLGIPLEAFVLASSEVDVVMFPPQINAMSFVYSAILTVVFAYSVNVVMFYKLKKIPMAESLKSVD